MAHVKTRSPSRLYLMNVKGLSWPFRRMGRMVARAVTQTPANACVGARGKRARVAYDQP